jgi:hypothetical protein
MASSSQIGGGGGTAIRGLAWGHDEARSIQALCRNRGPNVTKGSARGSRLRRAHGFLPLRDALEWPEIALRSAPTIRPDGVPGITHAACTASSVPADVESCTRTAHEAPESHGRSSSGSLSRSSPYDIRRTHLPCGPDRSRASRAAPRAALAAPPLSSLRAPAHREPEGFRRPRARRHSVIATARRAKAWLNKPEAARAA